MTWADDVRRANEALDWIEARQGPLPATNYARIETDVRTVRAMAEGQDDERISAIRAAHYPWSPYGDDPFCPKCLDDNNESSWPCDYGYVLTRLDALAADRDEWQRAYEQSMDEGNRLEAERDRERGYVKRLQGVVDIVYRKRDDALARLAAAEAANARAADRIMQDVLDLDPDDPEHPDTICISYDALVVVLENALRGADAALAGSREQAATEES